MSSARSYHTATLLPNGRVLVVGGNNGSGAVTSAELYDPATSAWSPADSLNESRAQHIAVLLPDGRLLAASGTDGFGNFRTSSELYDPNLDQWSSAGAMSVGRAYATATLLLYGQVVVVGGISGSTNYETSTEFFDPASEDWTDGPALSDGRNYQRALLLGGGRLAVCGGSGSSGVHDNCELLDLGLGYQNAWRPELSSLAGALRVGAPVDLSGDQLRGSNYTQASGGTAHSSGENTPLIQVRRIDNSQVVWLRPSAGFDDDGFSSKALLGLPPGPVRLTAFVSGIPSAALLAVLEEALLYMPAIMK
jgi:hypothetical protein